MLYRVNVVEVTTLWIEAESPEKAELAAAEDYIWGPDQSGEDYYEAEIWVEEADS